MKKNIIISLLIFLSLAVFLLLAQFNVFKAEEEIPSVQISLSATVDEYISFQQRYNTISISSNYPRGLSYTAKNTKLFSDVPIRTTIPLDDSFILTPNF